MTVIGLLWSSGALLDVNSTVPVLDDGVEFLDSQSDSRSSIFQKLCQFQSCQRTGESAAAIGVEGADGVCVLMMYCSGATYLRTSESRIL